MNQVSLAAASRLVVLAALHSSLLWSQTTTPAQSTPVQPPAVQATPAQGTPAQNGVSPSSQSQMGPIAIVSLDSKEPGSAAMVTGALQVSGGKAMIASNGAITSGSRTTEVTLPRRGVLRVCAATTVKLTTDASVPAGDMPGLMMVLDHGAVEASFATGRNSDILLTPDFRILIGGPGSADVKLRLAQHGDTCIDNAGINAPYVLVTSVFDGSVYRVQPGQRVMFQHGSLREVVDQEKEPCGCPEAPRPGTNDFPATISAGLAPPPAPGPPGVSVGGAETFSYSGTDHSQTDTVAQAAPPPPPAASADRPKKHRSSGSTKPTFFARVGHFFRRLFGAE